MREEKKKECPECQLLNSKKIYKTKGRMLGGRKVGLPLSLARMAACTESHPEVDS